MAETMTKTKGFVAHPEALDWLISTPHRHLVGENCLEHARALCRIIDKEATCSHPIWIIPVSYTPLTLPTNRKA